MTRNDSLRLELDAAGAMKVSAEYRARLALLKKKFQHTIVVLSDGPGRIKRFNCFAYAFGIWNDPRYERLVSRAKNSALMNPAFVMQWLGGAGIIDVTDDAVRPNDVVLYFTGDRLMHAGRVVAVSAERTILSKWGGNEVHEHKLWELPLQYGDRVRYFRPPDAATLLDRLEAEQR
jgi:hypothetical protein